MIKHPATTFYYQFLAEGILLFLICFPFTYDYYFFNHYVGYLCVIILVGGCFYFGENFSYVNFSYVLAIILGGGSLFLFNFPIGFTLLFPVIFLWRYTSIRSYKRFDYSGLYLHTVFTRYERNVNKIYFHMTLILGLIVFFLTKKPITFFFIFIQMILLLTGYLLSHTRAINKGEKKQLKISTLYFFPFTLLFIAAMFFVYFQGFHRVFRSVWQMILSIFVNISTGVSLVIALLFPNIAGYEMTKEEQEQWEAGIEAARGNILRDISRDETDFTAFILVASVTFILIIALFIFRSIRKGRYDRRIEVGSGVSYLSEERVRSGEKDSFIKRFFKIPTITENPVRRLLLDFEKWAMEEGFGRYSYESLTDWFRRLDIELDASIYEQVRYGEETVSKGEVKQLEEELMHLKEELQNRK